MRLAASRTFWTAGSKRPIRMAMMAMTTNSSMRVNPRRGFPTVATMTRSSGPMKQTRREPRPGREPGRGLQTETEARADGSWERVIVRGLSCTPPRKSDQANFCGSGEVAVPAGPRAAATKKPRPRGRVRGRGASRVGVRSLLARLVLRQAAGGVRLVDDRRLGVLGRPAADRPAAPENQPEHDDEQLSHESGVLPAGGRGHGRVTVSPPARVASAR